VRESNLYTFSQKGGVLYERFFGFSFSLSVAHILFGFGFFGVDSEGGLVEVLVGKQESDIACGGNTVLYSAYIKRGISYAW